MKSELLKTSLVVWAPIIIVASIYGIIYWIYWDKANALQNRWNNYASACQVKATEQIAKGNTYVCYTADTKVSHGFLGFPHFTENGVVTSDIPKP